MNGELSPHGGRWQLRFERRLAHPPAKVWRALTEPEHLSAWFPSEIQGERATGAPLRFRFPDNAGPVIEGEMLAYEPPSLLEFRWGTDTLRFEVQPDGAGSLLTLINVFDEQGKAARDAAGWHACLDALERDLAGDTSPWNSRERWQEVHRGYVERFGPEAATIGPPQSAASGD